MGREHTGLPDLALLNLAVAQQGIDPGGVTLTLQAQRHTGGAGDALTQRTGGHIHAGDAVHTGVALKIGVNVAQGEQILHREKAPVRQRGVQAGGGVALAQNEAVPFFPLRIFGIDVQFPEVQVGKHFRCGQAAAGVAGLGAVGGIDDAYANLAGSDLQLLFLIRSQNNHILYPFNLSSFTQQEGTADIAAPALSLP